MIHTQSELQPVVTGFTCDRCSAKVDASDLTHQEGHHIAFTGGYGSVFGDGSKVECDLCQDCLKAVIGDFCRVNQTA